MPQKKRRLGELFVTGKPLVFDDGQGDPVEIYMQKLSDTEIEEAALRSGAKRAVAQRQSDDHDSPKWLATYSEIRSFGDRAVLVDVITRDDLSEYRAQTEAELMSLPEWSEDSTNVLSLMEAWDGNDSAEGLKFEWIRGEEAPRYQDAVNVKDTLDKFDAAVEELFDAERQRVHRDFEGHSDAQIFEEATASMLERQATKAFMSEFSLLQIFFATRIFDNHRERYFEDVDEVRYLPDSTRERLLEEYGALEVDAVEGKDSPAPPVSSESSEPVETVETAGTSGPADATS